MRYFLLLLAFVGQYSLAQQKERTISITCYVNPELYIQAGVTAHVSNKAGNTSCKGNYLSIKNQSRNTFYYKKKNQWIALKPQGKVVIPGTALKTNANSPSVIRLSVKYSPDASVSLSSKIVAVRHLNSKTDIVQAKEFESAQMPKPVTAPIASKPSSNPEVKTATTTEASKTVTEPKVLNPRPEPIKKTKTVAARPEPRRTAAQKRPSAPAKKKQSEKPSAPGGKTEIGLRVDFGKGATGFGPNVKHRLNKKTALDAAVVFFEGGTLGVGAQIEQNFPLKTEPGLNLYLGIGPQFLLSEENAPISLVAVSGLEYNIPKSHVSLNLDWRPNFFLSPEATTQVKRFGLSLRLAL